WMSLLLVFALVVPMFAQNASSDDKIYDQVRQKLANDPDVKGAGFNVTVKNGAVTLEGTVHDEHAKEKAEKIAKKVKGVTSVINKLKLFGT
ncbi:MAG: BON domain-containing protein, partial [Acidobacteriia bacterium]|nr:BON domain-containing protein [Terriglobia bacterium]